MRKIYELKMKLKTYAVEIKRTKAELVAGRNKITINEGSYLRWKLKNLRHECRHHHIAYCELRNKTRDQIEKPKQGHEANNSLIDKIKSEFAWEVTE